MANTVSWANRYRGWLARSEVKHELGIYVHMVFKMEVLVFHLALSVTFLWVETVFVVIPPPCCLPFRVVVAVFVVDDDFHSCNKSHENEKTKTC